MDRSIKSHSAVRGALALLLVICLVECATGSCLSYGHSCWGAHGKRSGQPPASAPDWYLTRLLRKIASTEMENAKEQRAEGDLAAIFRGAAEDDAVDGNKIPMDDNPADLSEVKRRPEGIPMLDDNYISKSKFWKLMQRAAVSEDK